jgi:hypothetical protein
MTHDPRLISQVSSSRFPFSSIFCRSLCILVGVALLVCVGLLSYVGSAAWDGGLGSLGLPQLSSVVPL